MSDEKKIEEAVEKAASAVDAARAAKAEAAEAIGDVIGEQIDAVQEDMVAAKAARLDAIEAAGDKAGEFIDAIQEDAKAAHAAHVEAVEAALDEADARAAEIDAALGEMNDELIAAKDAVLNAAGDKIGDALYAAQEKAADAVEYQAEVRDAFEADVAAAKAKGQEVREDLAAAKDDALNAAGNKIGDQVYAVKEGLESAAADVAAAKALKQEAREELAELKDDALNAAGDKIGDALHAIQDRAMAAREYQAEVKDAFKADIADAKATAEAAKAEAREVVLGDIEAAGDKAGAKIDAVQDKAAAAVGATKAAMEAFGDKAGEQIDALQADAEAAKAARLDAIEAAGDKVGAKIDEIQADVEAAKHARLEAIEAAGDKVGEEIDALQADAAKAGAAVKEAKAAHAKAAEAIGDVAGNAIDRAQEDFAAKKKRKKWPIVLGVIVALLVVAGIGMWVWHEQPSFCGAICHEPMDEYLATYEQTPGEPGIDKWGNEVSNASAMMCVAHAAEGVTCLDCHTPVLSQQINEAKEWISGDFEYPLAERSISELEAGAGLGEREFCLNEKCHNYTLEELAPLTAEYQYNPHGGHVSLKSLECSDCHKGHRASVNYCTQCHSSAPLPEGWISVSDEKKLNNPTVVGEAA